MYFVFNWCLQECSIIADTCCYRPQRSCGKVMFLPVSVILSTGGGGVWKTPLPRQTPPGQTPLLGRCPTRADTPLGRHPRADYPPPPADGYCSGRYASYWNAFLFSILIYNVKSPIDVFTFHEINVIIAAASHNCYRNGFVFTNAC